MKRNPWKWAVLGGALAIILVYGIELSTTGIERINGPLTTNQEPAPSPKAVEPAVESLSGFNLEQRKKIAQLEKELEELKELARRNAAAAASSHSTNDRLPGMPYEVDQPTVNRMADSTSGLLQTMSSEGIRLVVSIFDGLTK